MKLVNRMLALTLAVMMIVMLAVPAGAESTTPTYSITIAGTSTGHIFEAYQIFSGNLDSAGILTEVEWGEGVDPTKQVVWDAGEATQRTLTLLEALQELNRFKDAKDASDVATMLNNANAEAALEFAAIVGKYLSTPSATAENATGTEYVLGGLEPGYYLIKDKDGSLDGKTDESYTEYILSLSKNTRINPKSGQPTVTKKVSETGVAGTYYDWVTQSIGSKVHFDIRGTVSNEIHYYDTYFYKFHDTMTSGLTFDEGSVTVTRIDSNGGTNVIDPSCYTVASSATSDGGTYMTITFNDLLTATSNNAKLTINRSDIILVHYTATVNSNSMIGLNNPDKNKVYIEYSNNPNTEDHGKTHEVDVDVYTFELDILKVDAMDYSKVLKDAEFILYRTISDVTTYAKATQNASGVYKISEWVSSKDDATTFITDDDGKLKISGLKAGGFYVEETKAPSGYNKLTDPLEVWIQVNGDALAEGGTSAQASIDKVTASVGNASVSVNAESGIVNATIENAVGTILPSTGGIGTTIFYLVGGLLVCSAIILLVTKKRMSAEA